MFSFLFLGQLFVQYHIDLKEISNKKYEEVLKESKKHNSICQMKNKFLSDGKITRIEYKQIFKKIHEITEKNMIKNKISKKKELLRKLKMKCKK